MTGMFGSTPNTFGSRLTSPLGVPSLAYNAARGISGIGLHRLSHQYDRTGRPGDGSPQHQDSAFGVDIDDLDVEGGDPFSAHPSRHLLALEDTRRGGAGPDRAGCPVHLVHAVAGPLPGEVVALDHALETLPFRDTGHVGLPTFDENVRDVDLLTHLVVVRVVDPYLNQMTARSDAGRRIMTCHRLVHLPGR